MLNVLRRHLFLLIGILTLCLFFLVAGPDKAGNSETGTMAGILLPNQATAQISVTGEMRHALAGFIHVLIVPMYPVWMAIAVAQAAIVGAAGLPGPLGAIVGGISLVAGLAPYAFTDYLLDWWREARTRTPTRSGLD